MLQTPPGRAFLPVHDRCISLVWIGDIRAGMLAGFVPDVIGYLSETPPPLAAWVAGQRVAVWQWAG